MGEALVAVEGVGKKFCRSLKRSLWYGVVDLAAELIPVRPNREALRPQEFWALRDVSFALKAGESLGLIGPNGAGKTTLLRMLSGLIRPDAGRIAVRGRMQALIALGAGFNPILSGRENIYVNAAVLGIPRATVDRRLDEIIDFSGIGEFIDAPVQSYSSGMAVRLGFSVAIHKDPDVLLVDEVLAVGDLAFRSRCARKLAELRERGVPWILVSHDMGTIRNQTDRVVVLEKGRCRYIGPPDEAIARYLLASSAAQQSEGGSIDAFARDLEAPARLVGVELRGAGGRRQAAFRTGDALEVCIDYAADALLKRPAFGVAFYGGDGTCYTGTNTATSGFEIDHIEGGGRIRFAIRHLPFLPGLYRVRVDLHDRHMGVVDSLGDAAHLRVEGGKFAAGLFCPEHTWRIDVP
jgi:lipopolysaccharide transport system ATP-binding protein